MSKTKIIGSGCHMNPIVLKKSLIFALTRRPIDVERELKFAHGTALRLCRKAKSLGLSLDVLSKMKPKEISKLYYAKTSRKNKTHENNQDNLSLA